MHFFSFEEKYCAVHLVPVGKIASLSPEIFRQQYDHPERPVVITDLATTWPAFQNWNWSFFKTSWDHQKTGIDNNSKSDAYTPINRADEYTTFGDYLGRKTKRCLEHRGHATYRYPYEKDGSRMVV